MVVTKAKSRIQRRNFYLDAPFQNQIFDENQTKICRIQFGNEENAVVMDSWYDTRSQKRISLIQNRRK